MKQQSRKRRALSQENRRLSPGHHNRGHQCTPKLREYQVPEPGYAGCMVTHMSSSGELKIRINTLPGQVVPIVPGTCSVEEDFIRFHGDMYQQAPSSSAGWILLQEMKPGRIASCFHLCFRNVASSRTQRFSSTSTEFREP